MGNKRQFFISEDILYQGFAYPDSYKSFVKGELPVLDPWEYLWETNANPRYLGLKLHYPHRKLVPFACRGHTDDIACFDASELTNEPKVYVIHDFTPPGWEERGMLNNFNEWLDMAKREAQEWGT